MKHAHMAHRAAKTAAPAVAAPASAPAVGSKDEFVRQAAYFYYEERGRVGGHELDDWLKAEAEFERLAAAPADESTDAGH